MTHYIFDCDDVLLNWQQSFAIYLGYRGISVKPGGPTTWCLGDWLGCAPASARAWVGRFNASDSFGNMMPMKDAYDVIWELWGAGHTISILTACGDAPTTRQMRQANLKKAFARDAIEPFDSITFVPLGGSKRDALLETARKCDWKNIAFVEDNYDHARAGARLGIRSYCLRRSHNRHQERENPGNVIWIDHLTDVTQKEMAHG